MDQIHKMPDWKNWLKGVVDGRLPEPALLVTGGARMETWRQSGNSLAFLRRARARPIVALC
jgi:predicted AAA+ superfamily ATPase